MTAPTCTDGIFKYELFPSIESLNLALTTRKLRSDVFSGQSSNRKDNSGWYATPDFASAAKLLQAGWDEHTRTLTEKYRAAANTDKTQKVDKRRTRSNVVGGVVSVSKYLRGEPKVFRQTYKTKLPNKTVRVVYDTCASGSNSADRLLASGLALVGVIMRLERSGYRVELYIGSAFAIDRDAKGGGEIVGGFFKAKDYRQQINLRKLTFPIANPSMLRRIMFRYLETHPTLKSTSYNYGYGYPVDKTAARDVVRRGVCVGANDVYLCFQDIHDLNNDTNKVLAKHFKNANVG